MYLEERSFLSGEEYGKPVINWHKEDKYAIIAFLLLSSYGNADWDGRVRFDNLFGLNGTAPEAGEDGGENSETGNRRETGDAIIRECEKFLDGLSVRDRDDSIIDEIDHFIDGEDGAYSRCNIGGSYQTFGDVGSGISPGQNRVLKHLSRKWDVDVSLLPVLETGAKRLPEISRERKELSGCDQSHREVVSRLAELDAEKKELWRQLKSRGVFSGGLTSLDVCMFNLINLRRVLDGEKTISDINALEKNRCGGGGYRELTITDKIGDAIEDGIYKIGDIISAPFEWMTDKLMGL